MKTFTIQTKGSSIGIGFLMLSLLAAPSDLLADWPFETGVILNATSPAIADIDGDGEVDIIIATNDNRLRRLNANGDLIWEFNLFDPGDVPPNPSVRSSSPTLVNVDNNPDLEIVVGSGNGYAAPGEDHWGRLYIVSATGEELARFDTRFRIWPDPLVIDADLDGDPEIYLAGDDQYRVDIVVDAKGHITLEEGWALRIGGRVPLFAAADLVSTNPGLEIVMSPLYAYPESAPCVIE